jgi:hypothetical protein
VLDDLFVDAKIDHYPQVEKLPPDKTEARSAINDAVERCIAAIRQRLSETLRYDVGSLYRRGLITLSELDDGNLEILRRHMFLG